MEIVEDGMKRGR